MRSVQYALVALQHEEASSYSIVITVNVIFVDLLFGYPPVLDAWGRRPICPSFFAPLLVGH